MNTKQVLTGAMLIAQTLSPVAVGIENAARLESFSDLPLVPRLSTVQLTSAGEAENEELKRFLLRAPSNPSELAGKRIAVLSTDGVEEIELTGPITYLRERGATVHLVAPRFEAPPKKFGVQYPAQRSTHILTVRFMENASWVKIDRFLDEVRAEDYDALIIPGGAWNPDSLRHLPPAVKLTRDMFAAGKVTAAICHGPLVFVNAEILKGRRATSFWNVQIDVRNAGAIVSDEAVVVDKNLITSRFPYDLPQFMGAITAGLVERK